MSRHVRLCIESLSPYCPGKPVEEVEREYGITGAVKLASNENPLGPSPKAVAAMKEAISGVNMYPDGAAWYLKQGLSKKFGVPVSQVVTTNGGEDLMNLVIRTFCFPDSNVVTCTRAFFMFKIFARGHGLKVIETPPRGYDFDLDAMLAAVNEKTRIVYIANPNNPTGTYIGRAAMESFIRKLPKHVLIFLDEAYAEYVDAADYPNSLDYRDDPALHERIITLRTFSKAYGLAGLRVAYGFMSELNADYFNRLKPAFNVNLLAQKAALAALDDTEHVRNTVELCRAEKKRVGAALTQLGFEVVPSQGNFLLISFEKIAGSKSADDYYTELLKLGVIVRPVGWTGLPNHHRISMGLPEQNDRMVSAYKQIFHR